MYGIALLTVHVRYNAHFGHFKEENTFENSKTD